MCWHRAFPNCAPNKFEQGHADRPPTQLCRSERATFDNSHGAGWALVGDAGYFKDPLTAHGITDALRDAQLLSRGIADGSSRGLEAYQRQRDELSLPLMRATDAIASFIVGPRRGQAASC